MIEYLYDAVRTSDGEDMTITATIQENDGTVITDGCALRVFDNEGAQVLEKEGIYYSDVQEWEFKFELPYNSACNRYFYTISHNGIDLAFKAPIYLV
nr:MAG TPA: hypothetical protein [Caudoviricetes sp.]